MRDTTTQCTGVRSGGRWVWLRLAGILLFVVVAGCGTEAGSPSVPSGASGPHPASSQGAGSAPAVAVPTRESVVSFGSVVVARLNQEAFYAEDASGIDPFVEPGFYDEVVGELYDRVDDPRWAIATFPGEVRRSWFVASPLTVSVTDFDAVAGTASVEVWVVSVFSREDLGAVDSRFYTERADLRWRDGGWLISGLSSTPGPSASLSVDETPTTPAELDVLLAGHDLITLPSVDPKDS